MKCYPLFLFAIVIGFTISCGTQSSVSHIPTDYRLRSGDSELTFQQQMYYIAAALEIYRLHTGSYPSQEENLEALLTKPESLGEDSGWFGPYAESDVFFTDPWNNRIVYSIAAGKPYDLRSYGEDGFQSEDDILARDLLPDLYREIEKLTDLKPLPPNVVPDQKDKTSSDDTGEK